MITAFLSSSFRQQDHDVVTAFSDLLKNLGIQAYLVTHEPDILKGAIARIKELDLFVAVMTPRQHAMPPSYIQFEMIGHFRQAHLWFPALQTGLLAHPFVALALRIKPVGT